MKKTMFTAQIASLQLLLHTHCAVSEQKHAQSTVWLKKFERIEDTQALKFIS